MDESTVEGRRVVPKELWDRILESLRINAEREDDIRHGHDDPEQLWADAQEVENINIHTTPPIKDKTSWTASELDARIQELRDETAVLRTHLGVTEQDTDQIEKQTDTVSKG